MVKRWCECFQEPTVEQQHSYEPLIEPRIGRLTTIHYAIYHSVDEPYVVQILGLYPFEFCLKYLTFP